MLLRPPIPSPTDYIYWPCFRLDLGKRPKEERGVFHNSVTDENFVFDLINVLAKAFLSAQDRTSQVRRRWRHSIRMLGCFTKLISWLTDFPLIQS